ncbi:MAG: hypothetical protein A2V46_02260 [Bacteroidetes bacterium RBG_19FT_COMBO_42_7]|nr:MAG: hypothetical protein A2V46_02260 [Bacteroidetes bacterium RBG_19FT_COMBO_42_7]
MNICDRGIQPFYNRKPRLVSSGVYIKKVITTKVKQLLNTKQFYFAFENRKPPELIRGLGITEFHGLIYHLAT